MHPERAVIISTEIDSSELVGHQVQMRTDQFPGKILTTRIVGVSGGKLLMDRSGSSGLVGDLIHNQNVEVHLSYKGEPVVFCSKIAVPHKGKLQIPLADTIFPIVNRAFQRIDLEMDVNLACFDSANIAMVRLNRLRWFKTKTINLSAGGLLVELPLNLSEEYYMIVNLGIPEVDIPDLIVGRVRHCRPGRDNHFYAGVEFVIREYCHDTVPKSMIRNLPEKLFAFDKKSRENLDKYLNEKYGHISIQE
ncbi:MAG: PilZ domain-containing protein [Candidatus Zixiibacteriota bacterium]